MMLEKQNKSLCLIIETKQEDDSDNEYMLKNV